MDSHYFAAKICPTVETAVKKARRIRAYFFHACAWKFSCLAEGEHSQLHRQAFNRLATLSPMTQYPFTSSPPRTYMGDGFTNT